MRDFGLFILRMCFGGLLAGHGAQKLFGMFEGHGIEGTGGWLESMGLRPGEQWAMAAGMGELTGGLLTGLGFMHPVGPIASMAPMAVAWGKAHWGKPIWVTSGGGELPVTNLAIALCLMMTGPGRWSMDRMFGMRTHPALAMLVAAGVAAGTSMALSQQPEPRPMSAVAREQEPAAAS